MKKYKYYYSDNEELGFLLRHGEKKVIAEKTGLSKTYVTDVLKGRRNNAEIINLAKKIIASRKQKKAIN